jgi:hypothetical protein
VLPRADETGQRARSVDHRRVHDLTPAGPVPVVKCGKKAHQEEHRSSAEVADEVQRRCRRAGRRAELPESARQREVVDVVPGISCQRAVLTPAAHPAVDQPRVVLHHDVGPQAELLHHAGTRSLHQHVGTADQPPQAAGLAGTGQVDRDLGPSPQHRRVGVVDPVVRPRRDRSHYADDIGAQIGEHESGVQQRADGVHLDDPESRQRPAVHVPRDLAAHP